jgi:peptidoglycan/xylan/chitin deacetylase (PgdA/CDA1 family)
LVSLQEAQRRIRSGWNQRACISITFDDGYADNCHFALPLLIQERIPCTYFVATRPVLEQVPFDHDIAIGKPLPPNCVEELRWLAKAGVEIGVHSRTHADLGSVTCSQRLFDEVVRPREELENALGQPVRYFAFPFGQHENLAAEAFQLAMAAGYAGVCSAYGGYNLVGDDDFHLQRRGAGRSLLAIKNWVTVDPFRNRRIGRFDYRRPARDGVTRLARVV